MMWKDGIVVTDDGEVIARPGMMIDDVRSTRFALSARFWQNPESPSHQRLYDAPFRIGHHECVGRAYFLDGHLVFFGFVLSISEANLYFGTTEPSPDGEEVRFYQAWVEREAGSRPPANFAWGTIGADYDWKTMGSSIYFKYTKQQWNRRSVP